MDEWSDYWKQGNISCLPEKNDYNFRLTLENLWIEVLSKSLNDNNRVLDLACGNGFLSHLVSKNNTDTQDIYL